MDKYRNLHGHRYGILCHFEAEREGDISTLFGDFDSQIEPWLKDNYDHGMLININNPLYETLQPHMLRTGEALKLRVINGPISVEHVCHLLFTEIIRMGFRLARLPLRKSVNLGRVNSAEWFASSTNSPTSGWPAVASIDPTVRNGQRFSKRATENWEIQTASAAKNCLVVRSSATSAVGSAE